MKRRFCLIRKLVRSLSNKYTYIYFNDLERPFDTFGQFGYSESLNEVVNVPFTMLEVLNSLSTRCFYNKCEINLSSSE